MANNMVCLLRTDNSGLVKNAESLCKSENGRDRRFSHLKLDLCCPFGPLGSIYHKFPVSAHGLVPYAASTASTCS